MQIQYFWSKQFLIGSVAALFLLMQPVVALAQSAQNAANSAANSAAGAVGGGCNPNATGGNCVGEAIKASGSSSGQITLGAGFGFGSLNQAINTIISIIFLAAGLAAFAYILLGAFNYVTAGDDSAKTTKARTMITNAVIGLILVALVYVIWIVAINLVPGLHDFFNPTNTAAGS